MSDTNTLQTRWIFPARRGGWGELVRCGAEG